MNSSSRIGKIARLPLTIRTELNNRLQNGESGPKLVSWLNALSEVKALLGSDFEGRPISEQNLSEWRNGGYRDWLADQETAALADRQSAQVVEAVKQGVTTDILFANLVALYAVALSQWDGADSSPTHKRIQSLKPLIREVLAIRKSEHTALRLALERDKLEFKKSAGRKESPASQSPSSSAGTASPSLASGFSVGSSSSLSSEVIAAEIGANSKAPAPGSLSSPILRGTKLSGARALSPLKGSIREALS